MTMRHKPVVLFRKGTLSPDEEDREIKTIERYFPLTFSRNAVEENSLVIGRMSVLPFYKELSEDLSYSNSKLINSVRQHGFIKDLRNYVDVLGENTPKTWFRMADVPDNGGPFVLKGETNSLKNKWNTHMFAENKREAVETMLRLQDVFPDQEIYTREFVPLETLTTGINGQPITKEFRCFCYRDKLLSVGYYWSSHVEELATVPSTSEVPMEWLQPIIDTLSKHTTFYVIDVAKTQNGNWIVIELNDGQMSGLSECDPDEVFRSLRKELDKEEHK